MIGKNNLLAVILLFLFILSIGLSGCIHEPTISTYTMQDVSLHNKVSDCWVVMNGNVYDFTQRLVNPVNNQFDTNLSNFCGKEMSMFDQNVPFQNRDFNSQRMPRPDFNGQSLQNVPQGDFNSLRGPKGKGVGDSGFTQYLIGKIV